MDPSQAKSSLVDDTAPRRHGMRSRATGSWQSQEEVEPKNRPTAGQRCSSTALPLLSPMTMREL